MYRLITLLLPLMVIVPQRGLSQRPAGVRRVHFTTHEGSWLSFDVSRDERWIALDLLGQLWRLPIRGGVAEPITDVVHDSAEFVDPVFSSDGASVLAHGEFRGRIGVFRVSVMDHTVRWVAPDTLTSNHGHLAFDSPAWTSDTRVLVTRLGPAEEPVIIDRDVRTGEERQVEVRGVLDGGREGAAYSADRTQIFFNTVRAWDANATFPLGGRIWRVPAAGGSARPVTPVGLRTRAAAPSPDGQRVAYFAIDSASQTQVWLQNLKDSSGVQLTNDADITPSKLRWLEKGDELLYVEGGRLWRLDVRTRRRREIPFAATVDFARAVPVLPSVHFPPAGKRVTARGTRGFALAPDGRTLALIALNRLWIANTKPGAVARVVAPLPSEAEAPTWSPDGNRVVWVAGAAGAKALFVTDTLTHQTRRLTALVGGQQTPAWSPDGRFIAFRHFVRDSSGRFGSRLRAISARDSATTTAGSIDLGPGGSPSDGKLQWSPRSDAVLVLGPAQNRDERPASLRFLDGSGTRIVRGLPYDASSVQWLPGDTLVFLASIRMWRAPFDVTAGIVGTATPVSDEPVAFLESSKRGDLLYVTDDGFRIRSAPWRHVGHIGWPVTYRVPTPGPLIVRNVRVIDGTGAPATAPRDILIERGRILRIARPGEIVAPASARLLDAKGRTAIPGLIDAHSHHSTPAAFRGLLYYGVTTVRNVSCDAPPSDALTSGDWLGPRIVAAYVRVDSDSPFNAGGCAGIWPEADADHLARAIRLIPALGSGLVKIHSNSGWGAQIRTVTAAHKLGTRVTGHCAYPLALVAAGIDSKEHLGWQCTTHDVGTWHDDLVQLYAKSGVPIVPTLALFLNSDRQQGAPAPVPTEVAGLFSEIELAQVAGSLNFRSLTPENSMDLGHMFDAARKLHRAGVVLGAGTDFERPDGLQYELEALVEASLTPLEAITAATSNAARIMGAGEDVGRIAPGQLGDLVILDADPTHDVRNTRRVWRVIKGGVVIDRQQLVAATDSTPYR